MSDAPAAVTTGARPNLAPNLLTPSPNVLRPIVELGKGQELKGNVFYTPHAEIYSDLHGVGKLDKATGLVVINGDVPDRGKDSWQRIQDVKKRVEKGDAIYGLGNHEALIMSAMTDDPSGANRDKLSLLNWLANGGNETAEGAGVSFQDLEQRVDRMIANTNGDPKDNAVRAQNRRLVLGSWYQTISDGPPQQGAADYANKLQKYNQAVGEVGKLQTACKQNQGLNEYTDFLKQRQLYEIVNGAFSTHAGLNVDADGNLLPIGKYGKGVDGLDNLQAAIRAGDAEAIHFLAGNESPLGVREEWLKDIADPNKAHNIRAQINAQLAVGTANRPACVAEQIVVGHTPSSEVQRLGLRNVGNTTSTATPVDRFVVADFGAAYGGKQGMVRVDMAADGTVSSVLVDAENGQPLKATTGNEVRANWKVEGKQIVVGQPPEQPVNQTQAEKAFRELFDIAKGQNIAGFGLLEIWKGQIDDWLKPDGMLGKAGWKDDQATREYLNNAQRRSKELGQEWARRINSEFGISNQDAAKKSFAEVKAAAEAKGLNVKAGDPEGDKNLDFLRNGHEYAKEDAEHENQIKVGIPEQQTQAEQAAQAAEAADTGIKFPEAARLMLEILKGGRWEQVLQKRAEKFLMGGLKIEGENVTVKDARKVAFGLDLQMALAKLNLDSMEIEIAKAEKNKSKGLDQLKEQREKLRDHFTGLMKQRTEGKIKVDVKGKTVEVQSNELKSQPNELVGLAQRIGVDPNDAKDNPITGITQKLREARELANEQQSYGPIREFAGAVAKAGGLDKYESKKLEDYMIKGYKSLFESTKDVAVKGSLGFSLFLLIMLWMSAMDKKGPAG